MAHLYGRYGGHHEWTCGTVMVQLRLMLRVSHFKCRPAVCSGHSGGRQELGRPYVLIVTLVFFLGSQALTAWQREAGFSC